MENTSINQSSSLNAEDQSQMVRQFLEFINSRIQNSLFQDSQDSVLGQLIDSPLLQNISGSSNLQVGRGLIQALNKAGLQNSSLSQIQQKLFKGKLNVDVDKIGINQSIIILQNLVRHGIQSKKGHRSLQILNANSKQTIDNIKYQKQYTKQSAFEILKKILGNELEIVKSYILIDKSMIDEMECKYKNQKMMKENQYHILNLSNKKQINLATLCQITWKHVDQLNLSNCNIDDKFWEDLINNLKFFPKLKVINLKSNQISKVLTTQLEQIFKKGINLLKLTSNQISERTSRQIAKFLISKKQQNQNQILQIEHLNLKSLCKDINSFQKALSFLSFSAIKKIKLSKNNLGDKQLKQILQILYRRDQHLNVQNLVLDENNIQNIQFEDLKQLNSKKYKSVRVSKKNKISLQDKLKNSQNAQSKKLIISLDENESLNINTIKKFYEQYRYSHIKFQSSDLKQLKQIDQKHKEDYIQIYESCLKFIQIIDRAKIKMQINAEIYVETTLQNLIKLINKQYKQKIINIDQAQKIFDYAVKSYLRENNIFLNESSEHIKIFSQYRNKIFKQFQKLEVLLNSNTASFRLRIKNIIDQTSESTKYESNSQLLNPLPQNIILIKFLRDQINSQYYSFQLIKEALYYCLRQQIQFRPLKAESIPPKINIICLTITTMIPNILMFQITDLGGNILQNVGFTIDLSSTSTYVPGKRWYFDILKESYMKSYPIYQKQLILYFKTVKLPEFIKGKPPIIDNNTLQQIGSEVYRIVSIQKQIKKSYKQIKKPQKEVKKSQKQFKIQQNKHTIIEQKTPLKNNHLVVQTILNYMLNSTNQQYLSQGHQFLKSIIQQEYAKCNKLDEQITKQLSNLLDDIIDKAQQQDNFDNILEICTDVKKKIRSLYVAQKKKRKNQNI